MADDETRERLAELESEVRSARAFEQAPYRAIVEDMTELVVRWLPDGTRVFVNDAYCRLFDRPRDELVGTSFWPLVLEEDRARVERRIARLSPRNPVSVGRHRARIADGREVWMEWSDRALFGEDGQVAEYQSVGRDVTERVRLHEHLRRVEQADAVARASAAIAHDLGNLLVAVAGQIELARGDPTPGRLDTAADAVERASALIHALRDQRYRHAPRRDVLDLGRSVREGLPLLAELAGARVRVEASPPSGPCTILGDPAQVDQVLLNLVRNAAEAAAGAATVVIATETVAADSLHPDHRSIERGPGRCCLLRVLDDAGGIPRELLPRIFLPDVSTKGEDRGLGLATVQAIVLAHRGSIRVENTTEGTCFEVAFPTHEI